METKRFVWLGFFVGSFIGSYIPNLWGVAMFSFSSIIFSAVFGIVGIWAGYKISQ